MSRVNFHLRNAFIILDLCLESCYTCALLPVRREQFNCLYRFPDKYGFGIIALLNCVERV
jgi:hypothetical protein